MAGLLVFSDGGSILLNRGAALKEAGYAQLNVLGSVYTFVTRNEGQLSAAVANTAKIVWRRYEGMLLTLIAPNDDSNSEDNLINMLDIIHGAMCMLTGYQALADLDATDFRLKIKPTFALLDLCLQATNEPLFQGQANSVLLPPLTHGATLQTALHKLSYAMQASRCAIFIGSAVVVATPDWWTLPFEDAALVRLWLLTALPLDNDRKEQTVYLPKSSPEAPFRLLAFTVMDDVHVVALCGAEPALDVVVTEMLQPSLQEAFLALEDAAKLVDARWHPSHLPSAIQALVVIDPKYHRGLEYVPPTSSKPRADVMATMAAWMVQARDSGLNPAKRTDDGSEEGAATGSTVPGNTVVDGLQRHKVTECSSLTWHHRCYAMRHTRFVLYVLLPAKLAEFEVRPAVLQAMACLESDGF
eukprot:m.44536 g.44536  ORF g.44536 m.44536 type:complete len:414 (+) comp13023_c0_seq1:44-1285(+)